MIGRLRGRVAATGDGQAMIDVNGVGYVLHAGSKTLSRLSVGQEAEIFIETQMSENAIKLYGFNTAEERAWFARLQDAPGVGAKAAMSILDVLNPPQLMDAIALHQVGNRPGRIEPRLRKRRFKKYDYMMKPRNETKADILKRLAN